MRALRAPRSPRFECRPPFETRFRVPPSVRVPVSSAAWQNFSPHRPRHRTFAYERAGVTACRRRARSRGKRVSDFGYPSACFRRLLRRFSRVYRLRRPLQREMDIRSRTPKRYANPRSAVALRRIFARRSGGKSSRSFTYSQRPSDSRNVAFRCSDSAAPLAACDAAVALRCVRLCGTASPRSTLRHRSPRSTLRHRFAAFDSAAPLRCVRLCGTVRPRAIGGRR